jgi:hypothetical protein
MNSPQKERFDFSWLFPAFDVNRDIPRKLLDCLLGFAAGVMLAVIQPDYSGD